MPRKDPVTGVMVQTWGEFWQKIADEHGTTPDEEINNFWQELDEDSRRVEQSIRENIQKFVVDALKEDSDLPDYVSVIDIESVHQTQGIKSSSLEVECLVKDLAGKKWIFNYLEWNDYGSMIDPPDQGIEVYLEEIEIED